MKLCEIKKVIRSRIENKIREIVDRDVSTTREVWNRDKAISHFKEKGEIYKALIIRTKKKYRIKNGFIINFDEISKKVITFSHASNILSKKRV